MKDYLFLMHNDVKDIAGGQGEEWGAYLGMLQAAGVFQGGSAIGGGVCVSKGGVTAEITARVSGYIRVQAESLEQAREWVAGNPVFEAGGTVEIRELPRM